MTTESIWERDVTRPSFPTLQKDTSTDVLIIGGGIAGLLCAYRLTQTGVDCMVVEADRICSGITKNTTAKITVTHGLLYDKLIRRYGFDVAERYLYAQRRAGERYAKLCRDIDCDYEVKDSYVYSTNDSDKIHREVNVLRRLGVDAEFRQRCDLPFSVEGLLRVRDQAQFHPLKFLYAIAAALPVYEHTKVQEIAPHKAITPHGTVTCKRMIVATHFPICNKHGAYWIKQHQHRSYVLALKGAPAVDGMYVDAADNGLSFRTYGDLLLLGGGGHRTGKSGGSWQELEQFAKAHYKQAEVVAKWATQDCMTLDGMAYVGRYADAIPSTFVATGFNAWGMTNAMAAADVLCDAVQGKSNPYVTAFSPSRSVWHPQLIFNAWESVVGLLTPTVPRCPHLGCALKYNPAEHSWDCPCHGSRFTESGELIDNPATDDKRIM